MVSGEEIAGPLVRLACQRHLDDLERQSENGLHWNAAAADRALRFFPTVLRLSGGEHEGRPFELHPAQQFIVGSLFGWEKGGIRRFRVAYVESGKGSGKSPLAAGIGLYMMVADGQARAEVYAAAVDKEQARILFRDAATMVMLSPALSERITLTPATDDATRVWHLGHLASGSFFRPIASESRGRGKSGFRPYCVLLDEVHEHPTDAMVEFTRKNIKGRPNALALMITNSGVVDAGSVCLRYHEYAEAVLNGQQDDDFFGFVCGLDKQDDWKDPKVWKKANPLLGVTIPQSYLEQEVREAEGMPSKQSLTRRLNFCEWMESADPFIDPEIWAACGGEFDADALEGMECFGALDLSAKNDLTALTLVFPQEDKLAVLAFFWTAADTLRQRQERDRAPYDVWVRQGHLTATPGKTIRYSLVAQKIAELASKYRISRIMFDRWKIELLTPELEELGIELDMVEHGQGFKDMGPAVEALEDALLERRLMHGNNPVLTWCVFNAKVTKDAAENRKFDKEKSTGRIDGAVALAMAVNASVIYQESEPQMFFIG